MQAVRQFSMILLVVKRNYSPQSLSTADQLCHTSYQNNAIADDTQQRQTASRASENQSERVLR